MQHFMYLVVKCYRLHVKNRLKDFKYSKLCIPRDYNYGTLCILMTLRASNLPLPPRFVYSQTARETKAASHVLQTIWAYKELRTTLNRAGWNKSHFKVFTLFFLTLQNWRQWYLRFSWTQKAMCIMSITCMTSRKHL